MSRRLNANHLRQYRRQFVHKETRVSRGMEGVLAIRNYREASYMRMRVGE